MFFFVFLALLSFSRSCFLGAWFGFIERKAGAFRNVTFCSSLIKPKIKKCFQKCFFLILYFFIYLLLQCGHCTQSGLVEGGGGGKSDNLPPLATQAWASLAARMVEMNSSWVFLQFPALLCEGLAVTCNFHQDHK